MALPSKMRWASTEKSLPNCVFVSEVDPTGEQLGMSSGSTEPEHNSYWFTSDHLGSSAFITDGSGVAIQHLEYMAFGEVFVDQRSTGFGTPYKFNAKELDCESGYYYYSARYYDPWMARFLSVDPAASKYPGWSPYAYVMNNPLKYVDPTGAVVEPVGKKEREYLKNYISQMFGDDSGFKVGRNRIKFNKKKFEKAGFKGKQLELANRFRALVTDKKHTAKFVLGKKGSYVNNVLGGRELRAEYEMDGIAETHTTSFQGEDLPNFMILVDSDRSQESVLEGFPGNSLEAQIDATTTHELLGHGYDYITPGKSDSSVEVENMARDILKLQRRNGRNHDDQKL